ncbi:hypothetical protein FISHEDRAFT_74378 [Fistulina hepatica ATCC 64428]|uniref:Uncharacterized protein n=1 Tax=Fistulina hepatica ATCC 64428 TaxID=1128425 RepID=A0A0D7A9M6_9AGAR|nr:hypothetical protein FISHEDRAFT_74378 [Fistulina hepatica ATCC 64428]
MAGGSSSINLSTAITASSTITQTSETANSSASLDNSSYSYNGSFSPASISTLGTSFLSSTYVAVSARTSSTESRVASATSSSNVSLSSDTWPSSSLSSRNSAAILGVVLSVTFVLTLVGCLLARRRVKLPAGANDVDPYPKTINRILSVDLSSFPPSTLPTSTSTSTSISTATSTICAGYNNPHSSKALEAFSNSSDLESGTDVLLIASESPSWPTYVSDAPAKGRLAQAAAHSQETAQSMPSTMQSSAIPTAPPGFQQENTVAPTAHSNAQTPAMTEAASVSEIVDPKTPIGSTETNTRLPTLRGHSVPPPEEPDTQPMHSHTDTIPPSPLAKPGQSCESYSDRLDESVTSGLTHTVPATELTTSSIARMSQWTLGDVGGPPPEYPPPPMPSRMPSPPRYSTPDNTPYMFHPPQYSLS